MAKTEAQKAAQQRYKEKNIELVAFEVKKGMSAEYTAAAAKIGLGKMEMIRRAIAEFIARHSTNTGEEDSGGADETTAQSADTNEKSAGGEGIPIIYSERTTAAQNRQISSNVQSIQPAAVDTPQRITGTEKAILAAVDALSPESKKALLQFLKTLAG